MINILRSFTFKDIEMKQRSGGGGGHIFEEVPSYTTIATLDCNKNMAGGNVLERQSLPIPELCG